MWTKKERFEAVLNHELADRPPVSARRHFTENEHSGADLFVETMLKWQNTYDWDYVKLQPRRPDDDPDARAAGEAVQLGYLPVSRGTGAGGHHHGLHAQGEPSLHHAGILSVFSPKKQISTRRLLHSALCSSLFCVEMVLYALGRSCVADPSCFYKKGTVFGRTENFQRINWYYSQFTTESITVILTSG